jgi:glucose/arabinose dehydrogenase
MRLPILAFTALAALASSALAQPVQLGTQVITDTLELPLFAIAPAGDPRLFVVEQGGRIKVIVDGTVLETPFLDLTGAVSGGNEQGLLGLAFHPAYAENGRLFINYTDTEGDTQIVAYTVSADANVVDPASAQTLLTIDQPRANHNGGWLGFGPDGYLYIGMGDGGGGGDPQDRAQNPEELLGKILRIDVDGGSPYAIPPENPFANGGGRPEIFALGARNPWRMAFDGDDLYIADVGQNAWEEINVLTPADAGANMGWNLVEGPDCYGDAACDDAGLTAPVYAYSHAETGGCSVTGGYVYRGAAIPQLNGHYFFADYCNATVRSFAYADGAVGEVTDWTNQIGNLGLVTSFGLDSAGELYMTTAEGSLIKVIPSP